MLTINNSKEIQETLSSSSLEPVRFPCDTNLLIGSEQPDSIIDGLEMIGRKSRRSVHLHQLIVTS